jgi:hypothetical protein
MLSCKRAGWNPVNSKLHDLGEKKVLGTKCGLVFIQLTPEASFSLVIIQLNWRRNAVRCSCMLQAQPILTCRSGVFPCPKGSKMWEPATKAPRQSMSPKFATGLLSALLLLLRSAAQTVRSCRILQNTASRSCDVLEACRPQTSQGRHRPSYMAVPTV